MVIYTHFKEITNIKSSRKPSLFYRPEDLFCSFCPSYRTNLVCAAWSCEEISDNLLKWNFNLSGACDEYSFLLEYLFITDISCDLN
ncbi:MAG: hypothetical protein ABIG42_06915 [bacterium]